MNHIPNMMTVKTTPKIPVDPKALSRVMLYNTSESWAWARERAQSRRYEAVFEIHPRQNSMVWMTWWMMTSPISNGWNKIEANEY
jgi:hypothetical protein